MTKEILVVPDPGRKKTQLQLQQQTYTDWVLTSLPENEADYLLSHSDLEGLIFTATTGQLCGKEVLPGYHLVHINEVACYMNFKTFTEIILMRLDKLQAAMRRFAAVWGGLDLTKNHRLILDLGWKMCFWCGQAPMSAGLHPMITTPLACWILSLRTLPNLIALMGPGSSALANHKPDVLSLSTLEDAWSLKELSSLAKSNLDQCNFMIHEGGTQEEVYKAQMEIQHFVKATLGVFITGEERSLSCGNPENRLQPSSLRVSARVDVSIITDPESQELHYFVTGISRGPGMMLYGLVDDRVIRRYVLEFAGPFECWISPCDPHPQITQSTEVEMGCWLAQIHPVAVMQTNQSPARYNLRTFIMTQIEIKHQDLIAICDVLSGLIAVLANNGSRGACTVCFPEHEIHTKLAPSARQTYLAPESVTGPTLLPPQQQWEAHYGNLQPHLQND
ncbi:hypothetical protein BDR07DRAFT_1383384 [Suillus spraguei]|nr:hypothetical protein BDR07DRAFT_1383384 [Suillus spraguei]